MIQEALEIEKNKEDMSQNKFFSFLMLPIKILLSLACLSSFTSCQNESTQYLHLAHTRSYDRGNDQLMPAVTAMDFKPYDVLMLGGDLVLKSSKTRAMLDSLDAVFDLSNPNVLWSLGNHDYQKPKWIPSITKRPTSYNYRKNGIMFLVLDNQEYAGDIEDQQEILLERTIKALDYEISHLIVLHHKMLWMIDDGVLESQIDSISNGSLGNCFFCLPPNNFYKDVYPRLIQVQQSGIQVICIAGDIGVKVDRFEHKTQEGIYFLASGLKDRTNHDKVLLFDHDIENKKLTWDFVALDDL